MSKISQENKHCRTSFLKLAVLCLLASLSLTIFAFGNSYALNLDTSGYYSAPETEVYVPDLSLFSVTKACKSGNISSTSSGSGHYGIFSFDGASTSAIASWENTGFYNNTGCIIVYEQNSGTFPANTPIDMSNGGSNGVRIVLPRVARYIASSTRSSAEKKDATVEIELSRGYAIAKANNLNTGIALLGDYHDQGMTYNEIRKNEPSRGYHMGAEYDLVYKFYDSDLYEAGRKSAAQNAMYGKKLVIGFNDIDRCDQYLWQTDGHFNEQGYNICNDTPGGSGWDTRYVEGRWAESITVLSGVMDNKIYVEPNTYLRGLNSNSRIVGTKANDSTNPSEIIKSAFTTVVNAAEFRIRVSGYGTGSASGFLPTSTIKTSTSGTYANKVQIENDQTELFWGESGVTVDIDVDENYELSQLKIDGTNQNIQSLITAGTLTKNGNSYTYTFNNVKKDHTIDVQATPVVFQICKTSLQDTTLPLEGAIFRFATATGNTNTLTNVVFEEGSAGDQTTFSNRTSTSIDWTTGQSGCVKISNIPNGNYQVTERSAPSGYTEVGMFVMTINNGVITNTTGISPYVIIRSDNTSVEVRNGRMGSLTLVKDVRGIGGDLNKVFDVEITITPSSGCPYAPHLSTIDYAVVGTSSSSGTFTLNNNKITTTMTYGNDLVLSVPWCYDYVVAEADYSSEGYTTSYTASSSGTITGDMTVTIHNTKDSAPPLTGVDSGITPIPFVVAGMTVPAIVFYIHRRRRTDKT